MWHHGPLLSVAIAMTAKDAGRAAIAKAGHLLIPVTAAITAIMIAFAFGVAGYWLEGAVAALGGGLSFAYLSRSAAGRIDTDQLNLVFSICYLVWRFGQERSGESWQALRRSLQWGYAPICLTGGMASRN